MTDLTDFQRRVHEPLVARLRESEARCAKAEADARQAQTDLADEREMMDQARKELLYLQRHWAEILDEHNPDDNIDTYLSSAIDDLDWRDPALGRA